jgi:hypothetical protein
MPPPDPPAAQHAASRQNRDAPTFTTLLPAYEDRLIIVAQGIEFHTDQIRHDMGEVLADSPGTRLTVGDFLIPDYLQRKLGDDVHIDSDGTITYTSDAQRVNFTIRFITSRDDYYRYLQMPDIHMVYNGHARYGRGPCFGDDPSPGNQWGNDGIWRMGFPFLALEVAEILEHAYFADPVTGDEDRPDRSDCHPEVRAHYSALTRRRIADLHLSATNHVILANMLSTTGDPDETFWMYGNPRGPTAQMMILAHADWQSTRTSPYDLGATDLQCRVFCHFGCDTFIHNYPVLRRLRGWTREDNERYAFWTTSESDSLLDGRWLHRLLTYPEENAFESWEPSLSYAIQRTNRDLRSLGAGYQLI